VQRYGCEECGVVGWRRDGEEIVSAGEDADAVPSVKRVMHSQDNIVGGVWMGECGHPVRRGSALERFFSVLTPGESVQLPRNE
jgi:hypothetical protein